jgi:hypothetical protein
MGVHHQSHRKVCCSKWEESEEANIICSDLLDLAIAFGGHETISHDVQPFIIALVEKVGIYGMKDIWEMVSDTLIVYPTTMTTNMVIAIYRSGTKLHAWEVGMHQAERLLGYPFLQCGNLRCRGLNLPGHIMGELARKNNEEGISVQAKIRCKACRWKLKSVKLDKQSFFMPLHKVKAPLLFYHDFPSPQGLPEMFSEKKTNM